jgi:hypothetical protein
MNHMNRKKMTYTAFRDWLWMCVNWDWHLEFAMEQWDLYWTGIHDSRLHDNCIYLIDKYGMEGEK